MKSANLSLNSITVSPDTERPESRVDDDLLLKSIRQGGIQQPLVVIESNGKHILVDGLRRLRAAHATGLARVPVVIDTVPAGIDPDDYRRRIRFILDEHRQDLMPSQKAELIETLKRMFSMNHKQVSAYLGVDPDSVTNWLDVRKYIDPVVQALDAGALTMQNARVFNGMSEAGQKAVWKKHAKELMSASGGKLHKELRKAYPPQTFPTYYREPEKIAKRLATKQASKRKSPNRAPSISANEKRRLMDSVEMRETELEEFQAELKALKSQIAAAGPIVAAVMRNEKLRGMIPKDTLPELERFAEIYC